MPSKARTKEEDSSSGRLKTQADGAISLLESDHKKFTQLLKLLTDQTENSTPEGCRDLLQELETGLKAHTQIADEMFYREFREAVSRSDQHLYFQAVEEHRVVNMVLRGIRDESLESEGFAAKTEVLKELVRLHIEEEESTMFPKARKVFSSEVLQDLGQRMMRRKDELVSEMSGDRRPKNPAA